MGQTCQNNWRRNCKENEDFLTALPLAKIPHVFTSHAEFLNQLQVADITSQTDH